MDMLVRCPACTSELTIDSSASGSQIKCPSCGTVLAVPSFNTGKASAPRDTIADSLDSGDGEELGAKLSATFENIKKEVAKAIVGQDEVIEQVVIAVFAKSHCLLEGVPGLAKTYMVQSLAQALALSFRRIQFTPDLMPSDITGTEVIQETADGTRGFVFKHGPIFAQIVLADEINRSPAKTQAALLEAMQERQVTVGNVTHKLPSPFFVLATQNPVEQEGTYALPEAQKDRFMFLVKVDYPDKDEEREIIHRITGIQESNLRPVITAQDIIRCQQIVRRVPVPQSVTNYVLDLVRRCRPNDSEAFPFAKELISWGPGPRACLQLIMGAKVRAILQGRPNVIIDDIEALALPVMRHRMVPTHAAEADGITVDEIIGMALKATPRGRAASVL